MAAPSGPIQTIPKGLLGLLQLKSRGQMPDVLNGNVQPSVDMLHMWLQASAEVPLGVFAVALAAGTVGQQVFSPTPLLIPENEIWYVHHYTVVALCPASTDAAYNFQPMIRYTRLGTILWVGLTEFGSTVQGAAAGARRAAITARDFWAPPGSELGFFSGGIDTAGSLTFTATARITRMQV